MPMPKRLPATAEQAGMIDLASLTWPVTYDYYLSLPWGGTKQSITVEAPLVADNDAATNLLGRLLWGTFAAPAAVGATRVPLMGITKWKGAGLPTPQPITEMRGNLIASTSPRDQTPQLVLMTGRPGNDHKRRLFMAGAPRGWVDRGRLTTAGWEALVPHAAGIMLGLSEPALTSGLRLLLVHPGHLQPSLANPLGVAFLAVNHIRVCDHTDRAPDASGLPEV